MLAKTYKKVISLALCLQLVVMSIFLPLAQARESADHVAPHSSALAHSHDHVSYPLAQASADGELDLDLSHDCVSHHHCASSHFLGMMSESRFAHKANLTSPRSDDATRPHTEAPLALIERPKWA